MIIKDEKTRRIMTLLSWFLLATVTAIIIWRYSKIIAVLVFILITGVIGFVMKKVENSKDNPK